MKHIQSLLPTIPVSDLERAGRFYGEVLGLKREQMENPIEEALVYRAGDSHVYVYKTAARAGDATLVAFMVEDLDSEMRQLREKGVEFEDVDAPGIKTKEGVAEVNGFRGAWFRDPDGNVLAINEGAQFLS